MVLLGSMLYSFAQGLNTLHCLLWKDFVSSLLDVRCIYFTDWKFMVEATNPTNMQKFKIIVTLIPNIFQFLILMWLLPTTDDLMVESLLDTCRCQIVISCAVIENLLIWTARLTNYTESYQIRIRLRQIAYNIQAYMDENTMHVQSSCE